jgi:glycosyltransferase involved in cell wall biosynthesis
MFQPRLRKVALKRLLDSTLYRGVARARLRSWSLGARARRRRRVRRSGGEGARARQRLSGARAERLATADLREQLGHPADAPLVLYVGRIAAGKGIDHLLAALHELPDAHLVIAGPDDRHGVSTDGERVHTLP